MIELQVEGMRCGHCASQVTKSAQAVDSAAKVKVDLQAKKVRVEFKAGIKEVTSAITEAGYPAMPCQAVKSPYRNRLPHDRTQGRTLGFNRQRQSIAYPARILDSPRRL